MVIALAAASPGRAETVADWSPQIAEASLRFGIPKTWIERVMQAESAGRTMLGGRPIRSRAAAIGLMQLMPDTWDAMRHRLGLGSNPDDPRENILAGTGFLRLMYDRFGYPGLFAAYNAGPGRYAAHLTDGSALPAETIAYLDKVGRTTASTAGEATEAATRTMFAIERRDRAQPLLAEGPRRPASLFAVRHDGPQ